MVLVGINDRLVEMDIDTGAAILLISRTIFDRHWQGPNKPKLSHMEQKLVTYIRGNITPCGTYEVTVTYDNQKYHLSLAVVPGSGPTLSGKNWLDVIQLSWNRIYQLKTVNAIPAVEAIIQRYPDVFKDELGELRNYTASLRVDPSTKPIFCKARHVPYALREKVDKELGRLESLEIIESIQYSKWTEPDVAVLKMN